MNKTSAEDVTVVFRDTVYFKKITCSYLNKEAYINLKPGNMLVIKHQSNLMNLSIPFMVNRIDGYISVFFNDNFLN